MSSITNNSGKKKEEKKSYGRKKLVRLKGDEGRKTIVDYSPKNFISRNLKLIPSHMSKVIEYLLYMKPSSAKHTDSMFSGGSSSALARSSTLQLKTGGTKSMITLGDIKKGKGAEVWHSFTSMMGLGKKPQLIFRDALLTETKKLEKPKESPSLFRIRSDPWPEPKAKSKTFTVTVSETPTLVLCFLPSRAAIEGTEAAATIIENNEAYWTRVKTYKKMYNVEAQTPAIMHTDRWIGMSKNTRSNAITQVCYSDIFDSDKKHDIVISDDEEEWSDYGKKVALFYDLEDKKKSDVLDNDEDEFGEACKIVEVAESPDFLLSSYNLLRSIDRNVDWRKQIIFKKGNTTDPLASKCPITYDIEHLWTLRFVNVWGMPVTCLCVNSLNPSIVAVGHGMYFMDQPQHLGRVCIWNFKNCSLPEKHVEFRDGVTSISFSKIHPFALLVSVISGTVMIVDISQPSAKVLISCGGESTSEPIWQVRWFTFDSGNEEPVACGDDGNVYLISKGNFTKKIFLSLARREGVVKGIPLPIACRKPVSVSDKPSVMCIATNPDNCYNYLVGTDDGCVHLCSTDYWHEHTDVFQAHLGPVHHIKYHPDCSKIFLTVGIDYCVRIWAYGVFQALINLSESDSPVEDADWSPVNPNIVASVASDRVSLWDISRLKLVSKGSITSPTGSRFTSVNFTSNGSNLICGDVSGDVHVYSLSHMPFLSINKGSVLRRTFKRILLGKKDLYDKLKTVGYPFDFDN